MYRYKIASKNSFLIFKDMNDTRTFFAKVSYKII